MSSADGKAVAAKPGDTPIGIVVGSGDSHDTVWVSMGGDYVATKTEAGKGVCDIKYTESLGPEHFSDSADTIVHGLNTAGMYKGNIGPGEPIPGTPFFLGPHGKWKCGSSKGEGRIVLDEDGGRIKNKYGDSILTKPDQKPSGYILHNGSGDVPEIRTMPTEEYFWVDKFTPDEEDKRGGSSSRVEGGDKEEDEKKDPNKYFIEGHEYRELWTKDRYFAHKDTTLGSLIGKPVSGYNHHPSNCRLCKAK